MTELIRRGDAAVLNHDSRSPKFEITRNRLRGER
jgi:hypothetical protein